MRTVYFTEEKGNKMRFTLLAATILFATISSAAEVEVPIALYVRSHDSVLQATARTALVERIRAIPNVRVVSDEQHAWYGIEVFADRTEEGPEAASAWAASYAFTAITNCGSTRLPVLRYSGVVGGKPARIEKGMAIVVTTFDEELLTPDRQNWPVTKPPSN